MEISRGSFFAELWTDLPLPCCSARPASLPVALGAGAGGIAATGVLNWAEATEKGDGETGALRARHDQLYKDPGSPTDPCSKACTRSKKTFRCLKLDDATNDIVTLRAFGELTLPRVALTGQGGGWSHCHCPQHCEGTWTSQLSTTSTSYHEFWRRSDKFPRGDRSTYVHGCFSRLIEAFITVDQFERLPARHKLELKASSDSRSPSNQPSSADYYKGLVMAEKFNSYII